VGVTTPEHETESSKSGVASPLRTGRLRRIFGPIVAGFVIDLLDFATFGPLGLWSGLLVGGLVGWWLAPELGFPRHRRGLAALLTGVYCMLPMTGLMPLATIVAGLVQLFDREFPPR
jgi:hypothetical protein